MSSFIPGIEIGELLLLIFIAIPVLVALRIILLTKPLQVGWLLLVLFVPLVGALVYLLQRLILRKG